MPEGGPGREQVTGTRRIYEGRIVSLREDTVRMATGVEARREVVEHADVVAIVPVDDEGDVLMVQQYRLPARDTLLEIPAGGVEDREEIEAAAQRELREETGHRAERLEKIAGFFVSPGYVTEFIHVFLASGLRADPGRADVDEDIALRRVPLREALRLVEAGEIRDAKSIAGLLLAAEKLARRR